MKRDYSLDFLRGTAVLYMIMTHIAVLFSFTFDRALYFLSWWGGTVCFTIFLFTFAAIYGMKLRKGSLVTGKELSRFVKLMVGYYILSVIVYVFLNLGTGISLAGVWQIITLAELQPFTEFILAFAWYILVSLIFSKQLERMMNRPTLLAVLVVLIYMGGNYLYQADWGGMLNIVKAQLVGHGEVHSFGILSYFPVYVLGLMWGYRVTNKEGVAVPTSVFFGVISMLLIIYLRDGSGLEITRWPPNSLFFLYGLAYVFAVLGLYSFIERLGVVYAFCKYVGEQAYSFYVYHIIILLPLSYLFSGSYYNRLQIWLLYFLVVFSISELSNRRSKKEKVLTN